MENKLPARERGGFTQCCICHEWTKTPHWHHTIPRSLGGTDSLQIPLDADCHNNLHHKADAIVAMLRGGKRQKLGNFWPKAESENRAEQWLQILIGAMLNPPVSVGDKMTLLPMIKVDGATRQGLELLKKDLPGITNLEQVLQFCINFTLKSRGLKNDKKKSGNREGPNKDKTNHDRSSNLW